LQVSLSGPRSVAHHWAARPARRARIDGDTSPPRDVVLRTRLVVRGSGEIPPAAVTELPARVAGRRGRGQPSSGT
jgi:hypothetical protein